MNNYEEHDDYYGFDTILDNEKTRSVKELVDAVYEFSGVGGNAHIVTDDVNLEDENIRWCLDVAIPENINNASDEQLSAEKSA